MNAKQAIFNQSINILFNIAPNPGNKLVQGTEQYKYMYVNS